MLALRRLLVLIIVCAPVAAFGQGRSAELPADEAPETAGESTADESTADEPMAVPNAETAAEPPPPEEPAEEVVTDEDIAEGSYLDEEEEDFRPSEEIGADQSIPFPTDI